MSENEEKSLDPLLALSDDARYVWQMLCAIVESDPSVDRIKARDTALRVFDQIDELRAANAREGGVEVKAGTSCTMFELVDVTAAGVTDEMVERYCEAVEAHLGSLTPKDWEMERFDPKASVRSVARIGLIAALTPRIPGGWKLVPCEPTWDMRNEGREFLIDGIEKEPEKLAYFLWKTMLKAAPPTPGSEAQS